jgi:hypothetical protein
MLQVKKRAEYSVHRYLLSHWSDMSTPTQVLNLSLVIYAYQYTHSHGSDMSTNTQVLALLLVRYVDLYTGTRSRIGQIC